MSVVMNGLNSVSSTSDVKYPPNVGAGGSRGVSADIDDRSGIFFGKFNLSMFLFKFFILFRSEFKLSFDLIVKKLQKNC